MLQHLDDNLPLVLQRPQYVIPEGSRAEWQPAFGVTTQYSRYIHRHASVQYFGASRHIVVNNRTDFPDEVRFLPNGFIGKYEVRFQLVCKWFIAYVNKTIDVTRPIMYCTKSCPYSRYGTEHCYLAVSTGFLFFFFSESHHMIFTSVIMCNLTDGLMRVSYTI
jgi:hypothetical protein